MAADLFILNLHGIGPPRHAIPQSEQAVWLSEAQFRAVLGSVRGRNDVELTFDDSNQSDFTLAFPALRASSLKARFFIVVERLDQPGYLARTQVMELLASGMEVGSHGLRHRPWAGLDATALHEELIEARQRLEDLTGAPIPRASCPFGSYNRRVVAALRGAGYKQVYTSDEGPASRHAFLLPRNTVYRDYSPEAIERRLSPIGNPLLRLVRYLKLTLKRWR